MAKQKRRSKSKAKGRKTHRVIYWLSHFACAFVVVFLFLTLIQCTIKKPEAPSWDTQLVVPLVNKTYEIPELIERIDQENLTVDSLGTPFFFYHKVLETVTVGGSFAIADIADTLAESLGVVRLDPFVGSQASVNLGDYVTLNLGVVPPVSFDITEGLPAMGEFSIATVETGMALVTIVNDFGLDLDTVQVTISDLQLGGTVASYDIPGGIPAGNIRIDTIDLSNQTISNQLELSLHCYTPGATSFSLAGKSLAATVSMPEGPSVSSATARIPEIIKDFSETIDIASDHQLQSATLADGQLVLDIENNTNIQANLAITLPDLTMAGISLVINQTIPGGASQVVNCDVSGYSLEPSDQIMPQSVAVDVSAHIDSSGQQLVTISAGDKISVTTSIENIHLATVSGIIAPTTADFDNVQQDVDIPKGFDEVRLPSAVLELEIENTVAIPGSFTVTIDGDQGQHKVISGSILPGTAENPVVTIIVDDDLATFTDPVPAQLTINGSATFGDGNTVGTINADDYVTAAITLSSPLEMIIGATSFDGGWNSTEVDQNNITKITDNVTLARFHTTIVNHLPIGIEVEFLLSADSTTLYSNPGVRLGPVTVAAGTVGPDGSVISAVESATMLELTANDIRIFENDPLWLGQYFTIAGTNGELVRMTSSDFLSVSGYLEVDFTVSDNLWED